MRWQQRLMLFATVLLIAVESLPECHFGSSNADYEAGEWVFEEGQRVDMLTRCRSVIEAHSRKYYCGEQLDKTARVHNESSRVGRFEPARCQLRTRGVDVKAMLKRLNGRKLYFVGDSLMEQMRVALLCEAESQQLLPEAQRAIGWHWQSWLVRADATPTLQAHTAAHERWVNAVNWSDAGVLVLNTGAWWNYNKLGHNIYATTMRRALESLVTLLRAHMARGAALPIVVWREISPALGEGDPRHNWAHFHEWNLIARELFERAGHHVLRIEAASAQRANDSHLGCRRAAATSGTPICDYLHWCNPSPSGVPLHWVELLGNMMLHEPTFWTKATSLARQRERERGDDSTTLPNDE
jgi:hypothetical protein